MPLCRSKSTIEQWQTLQMMVDADSDYQTKHSPLYLKQCDRLHGNLCNQLTIQVSTDTLVNVTLETQPNSRAKTLNTRQFNLSTLRLNLALQPTPTPLLRTRH